MEITQKPAFGIDEEHLPDGDPRCPSLLLLDVSGSMAGQPIKELQDGLAKYLDELSEDSVARRRVEVAVVTFGGQVQVAHPFCTAASFVTPQLTAGGDTPMGQAIVTGLELLKKRKLELASQGLPQFRAWVFLITDGAPTDRQYEVWEQARRMLQAGDQGSSHLFFAVGVKGADMATLAELSGERRPLELDGLRFRDLFQWLSASQKAVSRSSPGEAMSLPPVDWGQITS